MAALTRLPLLLLILSTLTLFFSITGAFPTNSSSPTSPEPTSSTSSSSSEDGRLGGYVLPVSNGEAGRSDSWSQRCGPAGGWSDCRQIPGRNMCCSHAGWCGDTAAYCGAGCQSGFGNCWAQAPPPPPPGRSRPGNVPYGVEVYRCTVPGTVAMTFDDGPYLYTSELLDILDRNNVKATFFITGNNLGKGAIDHPNNPYRNILRRIYFSGHHIGAHTWDHPYLTAISPTEIRYQMTRLETAFLNIIGRYPTYMRPPFSATNQAVRDVMNELGYHIIIWNLDTDDYNNVTPDLIRNSQWRIANAINTADPRTSSLLSIMHDVHYQTVINLVQFHIDAARRRGFRVVTLGECFGDPVANWYRMA